MVKLLLLYRVCYKISNEMQHEKENRRRRPIKTKCSDARAQHLPYTKAYTKHVPILYNVTIGNVPEPLAVCWTEVPEWSARHRSFPLLQPKHIFFSFCHYVLHFGIEFYASEIVHFVHAMFAIRLVLVHALALHCPLLRSTSCYFPAIHFCSSQESIKSHSTKQWSPADWENRARHSMCQSCARWWCCCRCCFIGRKIPSYYTCKRLQTSNLHSIHMLNSYAASLVAHFLQCFQIHLAVVFLAENRPKHTHTHTNGQLASTHFWWLRADDLTIRERLRGPRNCQFHHYRRF